MGQLGNPMNGFFIFFFPFYFFLAIFTIIFVWFLKELIDQYRFIQILNNLYVADMFIYFENFFGLTSIYHLLKIYFQILLLVTLNNYYYFINLKFNHKLINEYLPRVNSIYIFLFTASKLVIKTLLTLYSQLT